MGDSGKVFKNTWVHYFGPTTTSLCTVVQGDRDTLIFFPYAGVRAATMPCRYPYLDLSVPDIPMLSRKRASACTTYKQYRSETWSPCVCRASQPFCPVYCSQNVWCPPRRLESNELFEMPANLFDDFPSLQIL